MEVSSSALVSLLAEDLREAVACDFTVVRDFFPGASVRDVFACRLYSSIVKKLQDDESSEAKTRCLEKFLAANSRCKAWRYDPSLSRDEELFGTLQTVLDEFFHPDGEPLVSSYFDVLRQGRCGPGASLGANGNDFYTKLFSSKLTCTSPVLYDLYGDYLQWFPDWLRAEFNRITEFGPFQVVDCSSLSFVRKSRDIARSICTEPTLNMFFQLGLGEIISARLKSRFGIDLSRQPDRNKRLARLGSLDDDFVTIDLESASDSVSESLVEALVPEDLKTILWQIRTPKVRVGADEYLLHMISTMGNGFTFPLQTTIFAGIVVAAMRCNDVEIRRCDAPLANWGVFGDDIICPSGKTARDVLRLLRLCGFVVNHDKSYVSGPFRESCGADYYQGVDVRGVYLKTLKTQNSRYVAINRLNEWSARSGIMLPRTVGYLRDSVRVLAIPPYEAQDAGIRSPFPIFPIPWRKQRYVYRCYEPVGPRMGIEEDRITFLRRPSDGAKKRYYNPDGLWFSFIGGYVRNGQIAIPLKQGEQPAYRTRLKVAPFWGPDGDQLASQPTEFWARWNTAVSTNLGLDEVA
jgi:hypothetical protein